MGADLSRILNNPLLDFAGVELKQGGVLLDADFNELVAVVDRRVRAAASDILGRERVSSTTTDAFMITAAAGTITIGKGRLYVDGLLAECHGGPAENPAMKQFDPLMAEATFPNSLGYTAQPFFASPPALPTSGKHLVYLDVWEREVTHLERPDLVEPAVNVETSSREQIVWQVRAHAPDVDGADCATADANLPDWSEMIAPSIARLTTGTYEPPAADDPCELPPTGGYRGLENQTYRIEIHDPGAPVTGATFKWSRDNASIGSRVAVIVEKGRLELESLGRDDVLRFNTGDWVEIIDDVREQSQRCGEMRRITVDDAARTISFTPDLPAEMLPPSTATLGDPAFPRARNLRVRRWDHKRQVMKVDANGQTSLYHDLDAGTSGVIPVPTDGSTLVLENGITVQFAAAAGPGRFRPADHWLFAARTADASIELLRNEPPRGIHHHYARLGIWDVATDQVTDCRKHWPPTGGVVERGDCGCTRCVTPQTHASGTLTIQAAVNEVQQRGGGAVCIAVGQYALEQPVLVHKAKSLRIRGEGRGTVLFAPNGAFLVSESTGVVLEELCVISVGNGRPIQVRTGFSVLLQRLVLLAYGTADTAGAAIGLSGAVLAATIRENAILSLDGIVSGEPKGPGISGGPGPQAFLLSALLRVENNLMVCTRYGIRFTGMAGHVWSHIIDRNDFMGCAEAAVELVGVAQNASVHIGDNDITASGNGIVAGVDGLWIEGNRIAAPTSGASGAAILVPPGLDRSGPDECRVLANQVRGFARGGIVIASRIRDLVVKQNVVSRCGMGILVEDDARVDNASIDNNNVSDIAGVPRLAAAGIALVRTLSGSVCGNIICRVGLEAGQSLLIVGILAFDVDRLRVAGNDVTDIGPTGNFDAKAAGIMVRVPFTSADIQQNQVERESMRREQPVGQFTAVWIGDPSPAGPAATVAGTGAAMAAMAALATGHITVEASGRTIVFGAGQPYVRLAGAQGGGAVAARANASIVGNTIGSRGLTPAVFARVQGDCVFGQNRCEWRGIRDIAVHLTAETIIVDGNRVRGGEPSIRIDGNTKAATVLGNVTSRTISLAGTPLAAPWAPLNVIA